jgi:hypothetical protein
MVCALNILTNFQQLIVAGTPINGAINSGFLGVWSVFSASNEKISVG